MAKRNLCYRHHCQEFDKLADHNRHLAADWRTVEPCELCEGEYDELRQAFINERYAARLEAENAERLEALNADLLAALERIEGILTVPDLGEDEQAHMAFAFEAVDMAREIARAAIAATQSEA